ncbi:MAG: 50S ribosomal protein L23 [Candidatus Ranarchaeia archaeon]
MKPHDVVIYPVITEAVLEMIERENKLVFIVKRSANKNMIRWAVESLYNVKVQAVNTLITPEGKKKAFVRLDPSSNAGDIATRLGIF